MKKMKKLFAVLLTLAMVLGMSMTSFAADETTNATNYLLWVIIGLVITTIFILVLYLKEKKLQKEKNETS